MTKAPTHTDKSKTQRDNAKTPPKTSITQRLWADLGRSVGENDSHPTGLGFGLTSLRDPNLPTNYNNREIKRTHI